MNDFIKPIRERWDELKLELLVPAALSDKSLTKIASACHRSVRVRQSFLNALPIKVAICPEEANPKVLALAQLIGSMTSRRPSLDKAGYNHRVDEAKSWPFVNSLGTQILEKAFATKLQMLTNSYARDTRKIHYALFGANAKFRKCRVEAGLYGKPRAEHLHIDGLAQSRKENWGGKIIGITYLARLLALECEAIDGSRLASASQSETKLINTAKLSSADRERQVLRDRHVLRKVQLGDVVIMAWGTGGTLHCSSPVPPKGNYSAFLRSSGYVYTP